MPQWSRITRMNSRETNRRPHAGESNLRRAVYAVVLAALCAGPVFAMAATASSSFLAELPFLDIAGGARREACYVFAAIAFIAVGALAYLIFGNAARWMERLDGVRPPRFLQTHFDRRGILVTAAIIFICWIPVLIALYPCATTTYDTIDEIYQAFSEPPLWYFSTDTVVDASLIDHHPWFDTIVFGAFAWLGRLVGSVNIGLFCYGVVQTALTALALAAAICCLERLRIPAVLRLIALAFVILMPIYPATADTMQKDSLFSLALLAYALMYLEAFRTRGQALKNLRFLVGFGCVIALCILTKKTGIYAVGLSTIVLVIALKGVRIRALASYAAPAVVCMAILPALLFPALNIAPGGNQEMLGILYQQTITVMKDDPESVTPAQRSAVNKVLDVKSALRDIEPHSIDYVKRWARQNATGDDLRGFLGAWMEIGASHPLEYMQSMAGCFGSLLVPSEGILLNYDVSQKGIEYYSQHDAAIGGSFTLDAKSPEATQVIAQSLYSFYLNVLRRVPVISLLFTMGFYDAWVPLFALIAVLYSRRRRDACALAPILANALFLIVSPTALSRYAICLVFLAVPAIGWALRCLREKADGNVGDKQGRRR